MVISPGGEVAGGETGDNAGGGEEGARGEAAEKKTGAEGGGLYL